MMRTGLALWAAAAVLAGCAGGNDVQTESQTSQAIAIVDIVRNSRKPRQPAPRPSAALIAQLTVSTLEITLEDRNATAFLVPYSDRTDGRPGSLRTWRTTDDVQIVLRQGVLVATRGLGENLGSSNAQTAVAAVQTAGPVSGARQMYVRTGDHGTRTIALDCTMTSLGSETIAIVGTNRSTVHLRESCTGAGLPVVNDYWVDARGGTVWQSRQWIGPKLGYLRTRLLKKVR